MVRTTNSVARLPGLNIQFSNHETLCNLIGLSISSFVFNLITTITYNSYIRGLL